LEPTNGRGLHSLRLRGISEHMATRLLNIVLAAVLLVLTGPLLLIVALAIRWESPGPVLDKRASINRDGRRFVALTFRITDYSEGRLWSGRNMTRVIRSEPIWNLKC
jgi:lipopolysaccharide/colanic/teichoic acid biosynthesis glycosyltransferase